MLSLSVLIIACSSKNKNLDSAAYIDKSLQDAWLIDSQEDWQKNVAAQSNIKVLDGKVEPTDSIATFQSTIKKFTKKRSAKSIIFSQSPEWLHWEPVFNIGPSNLGDAPIALQLGEDNYWMFGRYQKSQSQKDGTFQNEDAKLDGFDIKLNTSPHENQYDAPGGLMPGKDGYHA